MKRYKENQKEEEKLALKTAEVSSTSKSERKRALSETKADISVKRQHKVREDNLLYSILVLKLDNKQCDIVRRIKSSLGSKLERWKLS